MHVQMDAWTLHSLKTESLQHCSNRSRGMKLLLQQYRPGLKFAVHKEYDAWTKAKSILLMWHVIQLHVAGWVHLVIGPSLLLARQLKTLDGQPPCICMIDTELTYNHSGQLYALHLAYAFFETSRYHWRSFTLCTSHSYLNLLGLVIRNIIYKYKTRGSQFMAIVHIYVNIGQAPKYLSDCVSTVSAASGRYRLRSSGSAAYVLPRTRTKFGERGFFYSGPAAWNTSIRPSWHYWYEYILETTQECTFWSCLQLTIAGAPGRVV